MTKKNLYFCHISDTIMHMLNGCEVCLESVTDRWIACALSCSCHMFIVGISNKVWFSWDQVIILMCFVSVG